MPTPYEEWPTDEFGRWNEAQKAFGEHVLKSLDYNLRFKAQNYAALCPAASQEEVQALAREAALAGVYAVMLLLDGVASSPIDEKHGIEYALTARVLRFGGEDNTVQVPLEEGGSVTLSSFRPSGTTKIDAVELAPARDRLCGMFHVWTGDIEP